MIFKISNGQIDVCSDNGRTEGIYWFNSDGNLSRDGGPASVNLSGIFYVTDGILGREGGPAVIRYDGTTFNYKPYRHYTHSPSE